jgi:hypothetical protein
VEGVHLVRFRHHWCFLLLLLGHDCEQTAVQVRRKALCCKFLTTTMVMTRCYAR